MFVVKDVLSKLKPIVTKDKLLVSVAAGVKLKDLQVTNAMYFFFLLFAFLYFVVYAVILVGTERVSIL